MYIKRIEISNLRVFEKASTHFVHPDSPHSTSMPTPKIRNVNLIVGNNALGKTTLLKAIAIAVLGPSISEVTLPHHRLIRNNTPNNQAESNSTEITADFTVHRQDAVPSHIDTVESKVSIQRSGQGEVFSWSHPQQKPWHPILSQDNSALFCVGYGATRWVKHYESIHEEGTEANASPRRILPAQMRTDRVRSLFEEAYAIAPLHSWLPKLREENRPRFNEIKDIMNKLLLDSGFRQTGSREAESGEYLFSRGRLSFPFIALSDGYRAFIGWVGDLLYFLHLTCPPGLVLTENEGIVMVDEIDLHIHPKWQMKLLPAISSAFPRLQFIVTSHSPLVAGSLEWMNLILLYRQAHNTSILKKAKHSIHGLNADQMLLTPFFGLESTRAPGRQRFLDELMDRAQDGDIKAAKSLLNELAKGEEDLG